MKAYNHDSLSRGGWIVSIYEERSFLILSINPYFNSYSVSVDFLFCFAYQNYLMHVL